MAKIVPMLGAVFAHSTSPGEAKGRPKPKTTKYRGHRVTKGEGSVTQKHQQHGELATAAEPAPLSDRQRLKESARSSKHSATESWLRGHMSTSEHSAAHSRADHVLKGGRPSEYKGRSGERKIRGL